MMRRGGELWVTLRVMGVSGRQSSRWCFSPKGSGFFVVPDVELCDAILSQEVALYFIGGELE